MNSIECFSHSASQINNKVQKGLFIFAVSNSCVDPIVYGKSSTFSSALSAFISFQSQLRLSSGGSRWSLSGNGPPSVLAIEFGPLGDGRHRCSGSKNEWGLISWGVKVVVQGEFVPPLCQGEKSLKSGQ